jgi:uncharacterized protein YcnI
LKTSLKISSAFAVALISASASLTPASAHIGIRPGVDAAGSTTTALTAGKSGVLIFRVGHGCTAEETNLIDPTTGKSLEGTTWGTHFFSVTVPVVAQGETGTSLPKPQYVPGFKTSLAKDASGSLTVTWTAISRDFDIPDGPTVTDPTIAAKEYADFGINITWKSDQAGKTVFFPAKQTCIVDIPGVKATKTTKKINARQHLIFNDWSVTDGSGADTVKDNTEHNTAPSVVVLKSN